MPSASTLPASAVASPQAGPSDNAVMSYVSSMIQQRVQLFAAIEQFVIGEYQIISQEIAQAVYSVQRQVGGFFGINPNSQNQTINTTATQASSDSGAGRGNSSGSGSGTGATGSGHNSSNQTLNNTTQQSGGGYGSGSGSNSGGGFGNGSNGHLTMHPMTSGTGTGGGGTGTGTGSHCTSGCNPATVYGNVWLDSDYDASDDNGELGYYGATVNLLIQNADGTFSIKNYTTTDEYGNFTISTMETTAGHYYEIQVVFPWGYFATKEGGESQINAGGYSKVFLLAAGGYVPFKGGLASMNVNITADDPNNQKIQNATTLRDAIQTGNNGPPQTGITFWYTRKTPLSGTITLKAALDPIKTSYNIIGPPAGASSLAVSGADSFGIFRVNSSVTSMITGLTIENGSDGGGGGVYNSGDLYLTSDVIANNTAAKLGVGGGVYNALGAQLWISTGTIVTGNTAEKGGGVYNSGILSICCGSSITSNIAAADGGGVYNIGNAGIGGKSSIYKNEASVDGGGLYDAASSMKMSSGSVAENFAGTNGGGIYVAAGALTLSNVTIGPSNLADNDGSGMYLSNGGSTTTFAGPTTVSGNYPGIAGTGVYQQLGVPGATVNGQLNLTDSDDPGGKPVQGP